ncbi:helix-turn-helix domain-containing protein [Brevundimonas sp.]|uniref:helix-turn-helix domain-containing protein n=1 Tax=Brevundimonas sp. TaxID=1871086 RepID=UPI002ABB43D7|nr:helix-turn-helix domain-containing protein [Brevundimonas sp.]MDZ4365378.1 helix-turn-helix domain-containing protein [Brevundimonas sp.]
MKRHFRSEPGQRVFSAEAKAKLEAMSDEVALNNALSDPDNPPASDEQLARMKPVSDVRRARWATGMTQQAFADTYGFTVGRLRDLEQGRTQPDGAIAAYLRLIRSNPEVVRDMLKKVA